MKDSLTFSGGPWMLKSWSKDQAVVVPNPKFWGHKPYFDQVTFVPREDQTTEINSLLSGEVSAIFPQPSNVSLLDQFAANPNVKSVGGGSPYVDMLWLNLETPPLNDPVVRQALAYAVDRQAVLDNLVKINNPDAVLLNCIGQWIPGTVWCDNTQFAQYTYQPDKAISLKKDFNPAYIGNFKGKEESLIELRLNSEQLAAQQDILYANDTYALLLVLQALDAAGKDSTIKHVMSGVNPQGCEVHSFKAPSQEELDHDYLWRATNRLPRRGGIGIFNRSYYEECLVTRVHPDLLVKAKIPPRLVTKNIWRERFEDITAMERYLGRNGTVILKFFLNVSKKEQKRRFLERLENPEKNWKFSANDIKERGFWDDPNPSLARRVWIWRLR
jgi:PPK2 family polyphosphate:nucleotide phosphotransferase